MSTLRMVKSTLLSSVVTCLRSVHGPLGDSGPRIVPGICQTVRQCSVRGADYEQGGESDDCKVAKVRAADAGEPLRVVEYLNSLRNFEKEGVPRGAGTESDAGFDLQRMSRLLLRLGDPLARYPVVHVAGTKGKGSTVAFLTNILQAAGFRVGSYTSPHIQSLRERIVSGATGQPISAPVFNELFDDLEAKLNESVFAESGLLTHFEVLTALAFAHFAREEVDLAIVEAGLGGARDATNVIQAQGLLAAVIVGIGEEHLEALGGSLGSIALAKAGIIKDGRPVILAKQGEALAENVVRRVAASKKAVVYPPPGCNATHKVNGICVDSSNPHQICDMAIAQAASSNVACGKAGWWTIRDLSVRPLGSHQLDNAATAIQTALCLRSDGWQISDSAIRQGVESTVIPGRFQFTSPAEAMQLGANGSTIILDGAHTQGSATALAHTLMETFPNKCVAMVVAMAADKDHRGFAKAILEGTKCEVIVTTRVDIAGSHKRSTLSSSLASSFISVSQDLHVKVLTGLQQDPESRFTLRTSSSTAPQSTARQCDLAFSFGPPHRRQQAVVVEEADSIQSAITKAVHLLRELIGSNSGVICITGSLHAVSATIALIANTK